MGRIMRCDEVGNDYLITEPSTLLSDLFGNLRGDGGDNRNGVDGGPFSDVRSPLRLKSIELPASSNRQGASSPCDGTDIRERGRGCFCTTRISTPRPEVKGKVIPVTDFGGPWGCETSRFLHLLYSRLTGGDEDLILTQWPPLTSGRFLVLISVSG
jgi:hypothetical protein